MTYVGVKLSKALYFSRFGGQGCQGDPYDLSPLQSVFRFISDGLLFRSERVYDIRDLHEQRLILLSVKGFSVFFIYYLYFGQNYVVSEIHFHCQ